MLTATNEKDVEAFYKSELQKSFPGIIITSPVGTDGYGVVGDLRLLMEFKLQFSRRNRQSRPRALAQTVHYVRNLIFNGYDAPNVILLADRESCYVVDTGDIIHHLFERYDWKKAASTPDHSLIDALSDFEFTPLSYCDAVTTINQMASSSCFNVGYRPGRYPEHCVTDGASRVMEQYLNGVMPGWSNDREVVVIDGTVTDSNLAQIISANRPTVLLIRYTVGTMKSLSDMYRDYGLRIADSCIVLAAPLPVIHLTITNYCSPERIIVTPSGEQYVLFACHDYSFEKSKCLLVPVIDEASGNTIGFRSKELLYSDRTIPYGWSGSGPPLAKFSHNSNVEATIGNVQSFAINGPSSDDYRGGSPFLITSANFIQSAVCFAVGKSVSLTAINFNQRINVTKYTSHKMKQFVSDCIVFSALHPDNQIISEGPFYYNHFFWLDPQYIIDNTPRCCINMTARESHMYCHAAHMLKRYQLGADAERLLNIATRLVVSTASLRTDKSHHRAWNASLYQIRDIIADNPLYGELQSGLSALGQKIVSAAYRYGVLQV